MLKPKSAFPNINDSGWPLQNVIPSTFISSPVFNVSRKLVFFFLFFYKALKLIADLKLWKIQHDKQTQVRDSVCFKESSGWIVRWYWKPPPLDNRFLKPQVWHDGRCRLGFVEPEMTIFGQEHRAGG